MTSEEWAAIEAQEKMATEGPWFVSDCDGRLGIWREAALRNVDRDETGEITGYRLPVRVGPDNLIAEWDLDTWDPGENDTDDQRRANAHLMAAAPSLLADVKRLTERVEAVRKRSNELIDWAETAESGLMEAEARVMLLRGKLEEIRQLALVGGQNGEIVRRWIIAALEGFPADVDSDVVWVISKRPHDQDAAVGPRIRSNGRIARAAGDDDPASLRAYAAKCLAAADAAEAQQQNGDEGVDHYVAQYPDGSEECIDDCTGCEAEAGQPVGGGEQP